MRVAIVHDYLKEYGGAERVVETFLEIWPEADVFTTIYSPEFLGPHRERIEKWKIHTSFLDKIPFKNKLISAYRLITPLVFKTFDLTKYDLIIVSQAGTFVSPNLIKKNINCVQITYCHTPPRWLYGFKTAGNWETGIKKFVRDVFGKIPMGFLRLIDFKAAQLPDFYLANSKEVARRIKRFYVRDATVIYPPVEIYKSTNQTASLRGQISNKKDYYLAGGRLARAKHTELAILAANELKIPLKIFGRSFSGFGKELEMIAGPTVGFLGEVSDSEKWKLYSGAKAFLYPSEDEDFGIQVVESMAAGTPVIALGKGGPLETIIDGKTGILFNKLTKEDLINAIKKFEKSRFKPEDCIAQTKKFSKERFKKEMLQFVNEHVQNKK